MGIYFWDNPWKPPLGLNADIERHRKAEQDLMRRIEELEGKTDQMSLAAMRVYRNSLCILQQSKAELLTRLGRK